MFFVLFRFLNFNWDANTKIFYLLVTPQMLGQSWGLETQSGGPTQVAGTPPLGFPGVHMSRKLEWERAGTGSRALQHGMYPPS